MRLKSGVLLCGAVAAAIVASSQQANAAAFGVQFGVDNPPGPSSLPVEFINNSPGASFLISAPTPSATPTPGDFGADVGGFWYNTPNGFGLSSSQVIPAQVIILAQSTGPAVVSTGVGGTLITQDLEQDGGAPLVTITALANSLGVPTGFNLLTVSGTGTLEGFLTPGTSGDARASLLTLDTVQYTDGFGDTFANQNWDMSIEGITPPLSSSPVPALTNAVNTNIADVATVPQFINTFTGTATGSFNATTGTVPEPASLAVLGLGAVGLLLGKKRSAR